MEEKKTIRYENTIRSFFGFRNFNSNFLRGIFNPKFSPLGFTLTELLVTIAIIGILAVGTLFTLNPLTQIQKANDAKRKSDLAQIQKSLELFYQDRGRYPWVAINFPFQIAIYSDGTGAIGWGNPWLPYIATLPKDPNSSKNYVYNASSDGQTYYLYASLDRGVNDPQVCNGGAACSSFPAGASCGAGAICNYGVSSTNVRP